jgi:hypothetical protein
LAGGLQLLVWVLEGPGTEFHQPSQRNWVLSMKGGCRATRPLPTP